MARQRQYKINPTCPHCGEEHCCWNITLTNEEQKILDAKPGEAGDPSIEDLISQIFDKNPLIITRKLKCGECHEEFDAQVRVIKADEVIPGTFSSRVFGNVSV